MLELEISQLTMIFGGNDSGGSTAPNCTTSGTTTTCSCPAGSSLVVKTVDRIVITACLKD